MSVRRCDVGPMSHSWHHYLFVKSSFCFCKHLSIVCSFIFRPNVVCRTVETRNFLIAGLIIFSPDGKYITAGSENQCVYLWRTHSDSTNLTVRKDRNSYYEAIKGDLWLSVFSVLSPNV